MSRLGWLVAALTLWGAVFTALTLLADDTDATKPPVLSGAKPGNRPAAVRGAGYVSSDACRSCHPGNYASWHASFHRTMTQVARPENVRANMDGLALSFDGWDYEVARRERAYFVRKRPAGSGAGGWLEPQEIVLLTGSHNLQILWLETGDGRTLVQFPFAYIAAEKMWAPVTQTFLLPPEFKTFYAEGEWNGACMDCHVTQGRSRFIEGNRFDSLVTEFGISCEACHSEGAEHVAKNHNPLRRYALHLGGGEDPTVANPGKLAGPAAALACGQCHSVWAFNDMEAKIGWNRAGGKFRPGESDLRQRFVVQPGGDDHAPQKQMIRENNPHYFEDRFWGDGMIRVTGRELNGVQASPCFRGGQFSCVSCHEMHPDRAEPANLAAWRANQIKPAMESDAACLQCHEDKKANLAAHTHHAAGSAGSACYNCHMPHTTFGLLRAIRSHQVSSPTVRESTEHGRPNACNLCHLDRPLAWTAEKLSAWYGQKPPALADDERGIAAGALWLLKGDAGQRALIAWSMGWAPAQQAAGRDWLYPYLFTGMSDPYAAVRFVAWRSLKTLPGFADFKFTYTADEQVLAAAVDAGYQQWRGTVRSPTAVFPGATLLQADGRFRMDVFRRLLGQRNQRQVFLAE
ncbi:MAG: C cytochrome precursor [Opitutae bacterium]|nr:C cytochrome precursor [Opitutae bacterium]